jgi:uncharacterized protein (TIGR03437 family)
LTRVAGIPLDPSLPRNGDGGPAYNATFTNASAVTRDSAGNLYVIDNAHIRKIDTKGIISTIVNVQANGIAVDSGGTVYVSVGYQIDRVDAGGVLTAVAGSGSKSYDGEGVPALSAGMQPQALAIDSQNQIYFADYNVYIRVLRSDGKVYTVPGGSGMYGTALTLDGQGNLYVAAAYRALALNLKGGVVQWAGSGSPAVGPPATGVPANTVALYVEGVAADAAGNLFLTSDGLVYKVTPDGILQFFAGVAPSAVAEICDPLQYSNRARSVATDGAGNAYFLTHENSPLDLTAGVYHVLRKATASGAITIIAGAGPGGRFSGDGGPAISATFGAPSALAFDGAGNLYISDTGNNVIRRVDTSGIVTTVAGNGAAPSNVSPACVAHGPDTLVNPHGIALDPGGNLYIADTGNSRIRKIAPDGTRSDIISAASGSPLASPMGVAVDASGNLYVADSGKQSVQEFSPDGALLNLFAAPVSGPIAFDPFGNLLIPAGNQIWMLLASDKVMTVAAGTGDGQGRAQDLEFSIAAAADSAGNLYAASGASIQRTTRGCVITTDQTTHLNAASGLAFDASGALYIADAVNDAIWKATPAAANPSDLPTPALGAYHPISSVAPAIPPQQFEPNPFATTPFFPQEPAAPGELVLIHGICLAPFATEKNSVNLVDGTMLPFTLKGVSVTMNGIPMPILWVTESTIEAQVPYEEQPVSAPASSVVVTFNGATATALAPVAAQYPALLTVSGGSSGPALAFNQDGSPNSAQFPARVGTFFTVYGSGFGAGAPQLAATGEWTPLSPLSPIPGVTATIGGVSAPVLFAGDAPRQVGVAQINLQVPDGLPWDGALPLTISVSGTALQQGQITVYVAR